MHLKFRKYELSWKNVLFIIGLAALIAIFMTLGVAPIFAAAGIAMGIVYASFILASGRAGANNILKKSLKNIVWAAIFAAIVLAFIAAFIPALMLLETIAIGIIIGSFFAVIALSSNANKNQNGWIARTTAKLIMAAIGMGLGFLLAFAFFAIASLPLTLAIGFGAACFFTVLNFAPKNSAFFKSLIAKPSISTVIITMALLLIIPAIAMSVAFFAVGLTIPTVIACGIIATAFGGVIVADLKFSNSIPSQTNSLDNNNSKKNVTTDESVNAADPKPTTAPKNEHDIKQEQGSTDTIDIAEVACKLARSVTSSIFGSSTE